MAHHRSIPIGELEAWATVSPDLATPLKLTARGLLARLN